MMLDFAREVSLAYPTSIDSIVEDASIFVRLSSLASWGRHFERSSRSVKQNEKECFLGVLALCVYLWA